MPVLDQQAIDDLFETLLRFVRTRERAVHTTFRTRDDEFEAAAFKALFPLARRSMRSRELAAAMNADPSTVSRHVALLVDHELIRREADPDDGRATLLVITDAGRDRVLAMREMRRSAMAGVMADWTDDELHTLVGLLGRFVDAADSALNPACSARKPDADA